MSRYEFPLADVGEGLDEAEIVEWLVEAGTSVVRDQVVVEVETAKSIVGIPAPYDGVLLELGGKVGDTIAVGGVLFVLETVDAPAQSAQTVGDDDRPVAEPTSVGDAPKPSPRPLASPATRHLALELGVDLRAVAGSGPGGRIVRDDVVAASRPESVGASPQQARAEQPAADDRVVPLRGLRREIARTMTQAWQTVPHITDFREVDATNLVVARRVFKEHLELDGVAFTFMPLFVKAVVATLERFPVFNASVDLEAAEVTYHGGHHIGLATATEDGLLVPVLKDAGRLGLADLTRELDSLTSRARARQCSVAELTGGTFTITNFGSFGGWIATPIIRPPESAIAGFGRIANRVVADGDTPVVRPILPISVSADHRLIDGDSMGGFLNHLTGLLAEPLLLLEGC